MWSTQRELSPAATVWPSASGVHVTRCFAYAPPRYPDTDFEAAAARISELLPGDEPLADRLEAWDARFVVSVDRLPGVVAWLIERFRARAAADFAGSGLIPRVASSEELGATVVIGTRPA